MIFEPQGRLQKASLRARVTWLAAFCVAGAVALVSLGAYLIVKKSVYDALDECLRSRAATVRVQAASTTGTSSRGTTQSVRRIASIRTSDRRS